MGDYFDTKGDGTHSFDTGGSDPTADVFSWKKRAEAAELQIRDLNQIGDQLLKDKEILIEQRDKAYREVDKSNRLYHEAVKALDGIHTPARCYYNTGLCPACNVLKAYTKRDVARTTGDASNKGAVGYSWPEKPFRSSGSNPDSAPSCSVCKDPIGDGVAIRKAALCEKCGGYSHNNCWAAHNLTYCLKRNDLLPIPPPLTVDTVVPDGKCWLCGRAATGKKGAEPRCETHL